MKTYTIKPLQWNDENYLTNASSPSGDYEIRVFGNTAGHDQSKVRDGKICALFINDHARFWGPWGEQLADAATIDDAKAAAETHYIQQMEKALEPTP